MNNQFITKSVKKFSKLYEIEKKYDEITQEFYFTSWIELPYYNDGTCIPIFSDTELKLKSLITKCLKEIESLKKIKLDDSINEQFRFMISQNY